MQTVSASSPSITMSVVVMPPLEHENGPYVNVDIGPVLLVVLPGLSFQPCQLCQLLICWTATESGQSPRVGL